MARSKYRYITVKVILNNKHKAIDELNFRTGDVYKSIYAKVKKLHGDFGLSVVKTGIICKYCNSSTGIMIIKARHGPHRFVCSALPFVTEIGKDQVQLCVIGITATVHQAYTFLKVYQMKKLESISHTLENDDRTEIIQNYQDITPVEEFVRKE